MKDWIYGFFMAWGMFLAIPCPLKLWNEKARSKMICCLPLVGLVVGGVWLLAAYVGRFLPRSAAGLLIAAAPWLATGFLHLDGFMDVCDAVLSRRDLPRRQEILKDSHCGAFAVISMVLLALSQWSFAMAREELPLLPLLVIPAASRACAALAAHDHQPVRRHDRPKDPLCGLCCPCDGGGDHRAAGAVGQLRPLGGGRGLLAGGVVR